MVRTGLAVGGAALVLLGGATLSWADGGGAGEVTTNRLEAVRSVRLAGGSGDVRIRHVPGAQPQLEQHVHEGWGGWWRGSGPRHRVDAGELQLDTECGWNCNVDYVLTLPAPVPVTGKLGSGLLDVAGMSGVDAGLGAGGFRVRQVEGPVHAATGSGDIDLSGVAGPVDAVASSGSVTGQGLRGTDVRARANSGSIRLDVTDPGSVDAEAGSGDVRLTVPQGGYQVRASTGSGAEHIGVANDPAAPRALKVSTGSGDITVNSG